MMARAPRRAAFRSDINTLRAIAVVGVVLFHFEVPLFASGFAGVDVFFVISGYLMTSIIWRRVEENRFSVIDFYLDRASRIIPALLFLIVALVVFGLVYLPPTELSKLSRHSLSSMFFVSNIIYWTEAGYFDSSSHSKWLWHTWSLSVEWQFYIIYPLLFATAQVHSHIRKNILIYIYVFLTASLISMAVFPNLMIAQKAVSFCYFMLPCRAWEMLLGAVVFFIEERRTVGRWSSAIQATGIIMIVLSFGFFSSDMVWPSVPTALPTLGTALVILAARESHIFSWRPIAYLGRISYSLYLWHWPFVVLIEFLHPGEAPWDIIIGISASIIAAHLSYVFVEIQAQKFLRTRGNAISGLRRALLPLGVVAGICAGIIVMKGLPSRIRGDLALYDDAVRAMSDDAYPTSRCGGLRLGDLRLCTMGNYQGNHNTLVVGDSFAEMWWSRAQTIESHLTNRGVVFATYGGCPPLPNARRLRPGFACHEFYGKALQLARSGNFDTVIFIGDWDGYFQNGNNDIAFDDGMSVDSAVSLFRTQLSSLRALGITVVVVTTSPIGAGDTPKSLQEAYFEGKMVPADRNFNWIEASAKYYPVDGLLKRLNSDDVTVIDPTQFICNRGICPTIRGGKSIYMDGVHLRPDFAREVGGFLDRFLSPGKG